MDPKLQSAIEYLESKGIKVEPQKSVFQNNTEMAVMLLTFMMAEVDYLRARVEALEGGGGNA
ncbi:hypothetical protein [Paenibacillus sp. PL2-23]|uniref:hypothetical protein n=1 Tax=Paenibacillus sp. PL2-23 TaxID=2100729 RepID=UPI0030FC3A69